jgi:hypothetical protein
MLNGTTEYSAKNLRNGFIKILTAQGFCVSFATIEQFRGFPIDKRFSTAYDAIIRKGEEGIEHAQRRQEASPQSRSESCPQGRSEEARQVSKPSQKKPSRGFFFILKTCFARDAVMEGLMPVRSPASADVPGCEDRMIVAADISVKRTSDAFTSRWPASARARTTPQP